MKKFRKVLSFFAIAFAANIASASTTTPILSGNEYRVGTGDIETSVFTQLAVTRGVGNAEVYSLALGGNYFFTDVLSPGLEFELETGSGTTFRLLPNLKAYYPLDSRFMPYLQAGFGYLHQANSNFVTFAIGPGLNYMLSRTVAIGAQFRYDLGAGNQTLHVLRLPIRFAIYFKY